MSETKTRKVHLPAFMAKVGLESLRGVKTINEIGLERLARLLTQWPVGQIKGVSAQTIWVKLHKEQARMTAVALVEALNALEQLLPDQTSRETALAVSAAVMMIEPTLANPRSEIIGFLMGTLGAEP